MISHTVSRLTILLIFTAILTNKLIAGEDSICKIDLLDTTLTFYIARGGGPPCVKKAECVPIYKLSINNDTTAKNTYALETNENGELKRIGGNFVQNHDLKRMEWYRYTSDSDSIIYTDVILPNCLTSKTTDIVIFSQHLRTRKCNNFNDWSVPFDFIRRIYSFKHDPYVYKDSRGRLIEMRSSGGPAYFLLAIKSNKKFIYKHSAFPIYKKRLMKLQNLANTMYLSSGIQCYP